MKESTKKMATVQYVKKRKPIKYPEDRRRENNSLVIKNIYNGGGDGCA